MELISFGFRISVVLLIIFYFSAYLRLSDNADVPAILAEKTYVYFIGPHESFSTWLSRSNESLFSTYGYNTFTSFFKLLGVSSQQGHYQKFVDSQTNIFLLYRGLLQDFGVLLTGLYSVTFICNYGDANYHKTPFFISTIKASICMMIYLFISPFIYTTFLFGFILSNVLQITITQGVKKA